MTTSFGSLHGRPVDLIRLQNEFLSCEILSYGATLRALRVPDRDGRPVDVVLGFDRLEDYLAHNCCFGAVVGPVANRIAGAAAPLGSATLTLTANDGANSLHGGAAGFDRAIWQTLAASDEAVTLLHCHPDGLGGYPGELRTAVTYWLEDRALMVEYRAVSDRDTLCNLSNHSYFNLDGHDSGPILDHKLQLLAGRYTPADAQGIPSGEILDVTGTAMDLRRPTRIGDGLERASAQLRAAGGYDCNWVLDEAETLFRPAARVWGARRGVSMTVCTDRPGVQFYTGNYIPDGLRGKDGAVYHRRQGLCLETQAFPDAPHHPAFPSIVLPAGREWVSRTLFLFETTQA